MGREGNTPRRILGVAICFGAALLCSVDSTAFAQDAHASKVVNLKQLSSKLQRDMTEEQVVIAAKAKPNWVSLDTCGADTQRPWQCKRYHYESYYGYKMTHELSIYFYNDVGDAWKVNNWTLY